MSHIKELKNILETAKEIVENWRRYNRYNLIVIARLFCEGLKSKFLDFLAQIYRSMCADRQFMYYNIIEILLVDYY